MLGIRPATLAKKIAQTLYLKKAEDILILDIRELSGIADFFIICSGTSDRHVKAIADAVLDELTEKKIKPWHKEGYENLQWILLDYVDVVVHVFQNETREFYSLERLWGDAEVIPVTSEKIGSLAKRK